MWAKPKAQKKEVNVKIDTERNENLSRNTWIVSAAEFTPKIIQTKEERVNLLYMP
jgi:HlyD family secretion protein